MAVHTSAILKVIRSASANETSDRDLLRRFVNKDDQAAFALLVRRHGNMVLGVCRRKLPTLQDSEDACQATFLVLAQKAKSHHWQPSIANWLYATARKVSRNISVSTRRRGRRENEAAVPEACNSADRLSAQELLTAVDDELDRLAPRYREPLVLCYLEGLTRDEAAGRLGIPTATLKVRLERGRKKLGDALTRRGFGLGSGLLALAATSAAEASSGLVEKILAARPGTAAASIAAIASGGSVTKTALFAAVAAVTVVGIAVGSMLVHEGMPIAAASSDPPAAKTPPKPEAKPTPPKANPDASVFRGRVLDSTGKPLAGAKLFVFSRRNGRIAAPQPVTDAEGRFRFEITTSDPYGRFLVATANGYGLDWAELARSTAGSELTLRLPDDMPIHGKVVDLEGKPISRASVRAVEVTTTASGSLDHFVKRLAAAKTKAEADKVHDMLDGRQLPAVKALAEFGAAVTGPDGVFRLAGIGRDRTTTLEVRGLGIANHQVRVITRRDLPPSKLLPLYGPELTIAVSPSKPIIGTVRDSATHKPLSGIKVTAFGGNEDWSNSVETHTDADGKYRAEGLKRADTFMLAFEPDNGSGYLHWHGSLESKVGFEPLVYDAKLIRGIVVRGKVSDGGTGRPVKAQVSYAPFFSNPALRSTPGYAEPPTVIGTFAFTGKDGEYALTVIPGTAGLFVRALDGEGSFTTAHVRVEDRKPPDYIKRSFGEEMFWQAGPIYRLDEIHAYRVIRPEADDRELAEDFSLDRGAKRHGRLVDSLGQPVTGVEAINLAPISPWPKERIILPGPDFTAESLTPDKPRWVLFYHDKLKLAGTMQLKGNEPEPLIVTMQPLAGIRGRAVQMNGTPLAGYEVHPSYWPILNREPMQKGKAPTITDKDGYYVLPELPAGFPIRVWFHLPNTNNIVIDHLNVILEPGKTKDLGTLVGEPYEP